MDLLAVATLLGSLFTGASVLVALESYRRTELKQSFERFRLRIVEVRERFNRIRNRSSEPLFVQVGENIGSEITKLLPEPLTGEELIAFLKNKRNHNYIASCIHIGMAKSTSIPELFENRQRLEGIGYEIREQFPVVSYTMQNLTRILTYTANAPISPGAYIANLSDHHEPIDELAESLKEIAEPRLIARQLTGYIAEISSSHSGKFGNQIILECIRLFDFVASSYLRLSDGELRGERRRQARLASQLSRIQQGPARLEEDLLQFLKMQQHLLTADWDDVVASRTRLQAAVEQGEKLSGRED